MTDAVIFDLDGTLADVTHRLHHIRKSPPDWPAFFAACPDDPVIPSAKSLALSVFYAGAPDAALIICSGRPKDHEEETRAWLRRHGIFYDDLMMRPIGDHRPDTVVKLEMLTRLRLRGFNVLYSIDDRPSVVKMWRENGVPCFACDDANWRTHQSHFFGSAEFPHAGKTLLTLMVGPTGAGKSTWLRLTEPLAMMDPAVTAAHYDIRQSHILSSDQFRADLCGDWRDQTRNEEVFAAIHAVARARLASGLPTVIDATHLRRKDRMAAAALAPGGSKVRYIVMNRPMSAKLADNKSVPVTVTAKHDQTFRSQLKDILAGDGLANVEVIDLRPAEAR